MNKTIKRWINGAAVIAICTMAQVAFAMGGNYGKSDPKHPVSSPSWAKGVSVLANRRERSSGRWLNGSSWFYYSGDAKAFNDFLKQYAKVKSTPLLLYLGDPKELLVVTTSETSSGYDWEMSITGWDSTNISVTLPLNNSIRLKDIKIPANLSVEFIGKKTPEIEALLARHKKQEVGK